jgi:hypothetical protein
MAAVLTTASGNKVIYRHPDPNRTESLSANNHKGDKLCQAKPSARSTKLPEPAHRTTTGGPTSCGWISCANIPPSPILWGRLSTTRKNSRVSTWRQ